MIKFILAFFFILISFFGNCQTDSLKKNNEISIGTSLIILTNLNEVQINPCIDYLHSFNRFGLGVGYSYNESVGIIVSFPLEKFNASFYNGIRLTNDSLLDRVSYPYTVSFSIEIPFKINRLCIAVYEEMEYHTDKLTVSLGLHMGIDW